LMNTCGKTVLHFMLLSPFAFHKFCQNWPNQVTTCLVLLVLPWKRRCTWLTQKHRWRNKGTTCLTKSGANANTGGRLDFARRT
jgi:hypothetical protein